MLISALLFAVGLFLLIKGGNIFVNNAVGISRRLGLSEFIIGATVVSLGTTLPEVMVSVLAAIDGHGETSYGNAIGSVICNTALIAAISIAVKPCETNKKSLKTSVCFFFLAASFYSLNVYLTGYFSRISGIILLGIFFVYMYISILISEKKNFQLYNETTIQGSKNALLVKNIIFLVIGVAIVTIGSNLLVENGIKIAEFMNVPESVIALTFVALGTSLPEFTTAITSLVKGHEELSLGNIIGANLFNLVLVSGLSVAISPFEVPDGKIIFGKSSSLILDIPLMILVMAILTIPILFGKKVSRIQGIILMTLYFLFCFIQFTL